MLAKYNILVMNQNSFCKLYTILCMHRSQWRTLGVGQAEAQAALQMILKDCKNLAPNRPKSHQCKKIIISNNGYLIYNYFLKNKPKCKHYAQ